MPQELSVEERNLRRLQRHRQPPRQLARRQPIEQKGDSERIELIQEYRKTSRSLSPSALTSLRSSTTSSSPTAPRRGPRLLLQDEGDYYRYMHEFQAGDDRKQSAGPCLHAYNQASNIANQSLADPPDPPARAQLFRPSTTRFEPAERARHLAKQAFDDATPADTLSEESYKDSTSLRSSVTTSRCGRARPARPRAER